MSNKKKLFKKKRIKKIKVNVVLVDNKDARVIHTDYVKVSESQYAYENHLWNFDVNNNSYTDLEGNPIILYDLSGNVLKFQKSDKNQDNSEFDDLMFSKNMIKQLAKASLPSANKLGVQDYLMYVFIFIGGLGVGLFLPSVL